MPYDPALHGPERIVGPGFHQRVFALVRCVPPGSVVTYGDVATALGRRGIARQVGYALAALPADSDVPWHRVVNARGVVVERGLGTGRQWMRLAEEGVLATEDGRVLEFRNRRHRFAERIREEHRRSGSGS